MKISAWGGYEIRANNESIFQSFFEILGTPCDCGPSVRHLSEDELSAGCVFETFCVSFSYNVKRSYYCNNLTSYCKELGELKMRN